MKTRQFAQIAVIVIALLLGFLSFVYANGIKLPPENNCPSATLVQTKADICVGDELSNKNETFHRGWPRVYQRVYINFSETKFASSEEFDQKNLAINLAIWAVIMIGAGAIGLILVNQKYPKGKK